MKIPFINSEWRVLLRPEINEKYYITTCGWRGCGSPNEGCVSIAELGWKEI